MPKTKKKYTPFVTTIVVIIMATVLMTFQIRSGQRPTFITNRIIYLYSACHKLANYAIHPVIELWETYVWLVGVKQDSVKLKTEVDRLKEINNHYLEYKM